MKIKTENILEDQVELMRLYLLTIKHYVFGLLTI